MPRIQKIPRMPVNYVVMHEQSLPLLTRADLAKHPVVGLAFITANPDIVHYVRQVIGRFAGIPLVYYDVSNDTSYNDKGPEINVRKLKNNYPDMRYIIVVNEVPINIEKTCRKRSGGPPGSFFPRCSADSEEKVTDEYTTTYEAKLDVILLDLQKELLLAMSSDNFKRVDRHYDSWCERRENKILKIIVKELLLPRCSKKSHPQVSYLDGKKVGFYVYNFLDQINTGTPGQNR
ncbi:MAG TPA: hypothetical protein ENG95_05530 [Nitrospirae bacterium]|nr:hypothetical protein [Nitrospirota bacterium]